MKNGRIKVHSKMGGGMNKYMGGGSVKKKKVVKLKVGGALTDYYKGMM